MAVTRPARNQAAAISLLVARVINLVGIPGRLNLPRHFVWALTMPDIRN
jgi:hypothetical protein